MYDERTASTREFRMSTAVGVTGEAVEAMEQWALVILWSPREPERTGEVALLGTGGGEWVLGRDPSHATPSEGEPPASTPRRPVIFFRQRPPGIEGGTSPEDASPFILGEWISRRQLVLRPTPEGLLIHNIGRCPLLINGEPVTGGLAPAGATIQLQDQLLLHCTKRPRRMPRLTCYPTSCVREFGKADAFGIVGESPIVWRLRDRLAMLSRDPAHVLIVGESGAGKELAAQTIHGLSARARKQLISHNIAAIAPGIAAAQLFGTPRDFPQKGMAERKGLIGGAHESTLFLDEIGDMPAEVEPMFLRVLDGNHEYHRVGEENERPLRSDFRLIGATNRPDQMRFELRNRFAKTAQVPSLHERREDIPLLVRHILDEHRSKGDVEATRFYEGGQPQVSMPLVEHLMRHRFLGHVREIAILLGEAMEKSRGSRLECCTIPPRSSANPSVATIAAGRRVTPTAQPVATTMPPPGVPDVDGDADVPVVPAPAATIAAGDPAAQLKALRDRLRVLSDPEKSTLRELIERTYRMCDGDFSQTAIRLGLTRYQLYRLVRRLGWKTTRILALGS